MWATLGNDPSSDGAASSPSPGTSSSRPQLAGAICWRPLLRMPGLSPRLSHILPGGSYNL